MEYGLWSACGEGRLVVFTTNHIVELVCRGRMDMHIELSYCGYEAFLAQAKNYLDIDKHPLFEKIKVLLSETNACPADVAENLMPKRLPLDDESIVESSLKALIGALEKAKEEDRLKAQAEEEKKREKVEVKDGNEDIEVEENEKEAAEAKDGIEGVEVEEKKPVTVVRTRIRSELYQLLVH